MSKNLQDIILILHISALAQDARQCQLSGNGHSCWLPQPFPVQEPSSCMAYTIFMQDKLLSSSEIYLLCGKINQDRRSSSDCLSKFPCIFHIPNFSSTGREQAYGHKVQYDGSDYRSNYGTSEWKSKSAGKAHR